MSILLTAVVNVFILKKKYLPIFKTPISLHYLDLSSLFALNLNISSFNSSESTVNFNSR